MKIGNLLDVLLLMLSSIWTDLFTSYSNGWLNTYYLWTQKPTQIGAFLSCHPSRWLKFIFAWWLCLVIKFWIQRFYASWYKNHHHFVRCLVAMTCFFPLWVSVFPNTSVAPLSVDSSTAPSSPIILTSASRHKQWWCDLIFHRVSAATPSCPKLIMGGSLIISPPRWALKPYGVIGRSYRKPVRGGHSRNYLWHLPALFSEQREVGAEFGHQPTTRRSSKYSK